MMNKNIELYIITKLERGSLSYWKLIKDCPFSLSQLIPVLNSLFIQGTIHTDGDYLKLNAPPDTLQISAMKCPTCEGRGLINSHYFTEVMHKFSQLVNDRPQATGEFNQGYVLPECTIYRLQFMYNQGDLKGKKVAFLGDDDLVSLGAGLLGICQEIVALDIDKRIIDYLKTTVPSYFKNFEALIYDVNNTWPEKYLNYFDVIFTDPVETYEGMKLFLSRVVDGLKGEGSALYFGITHLESPLAKWLKIQESLISMNMCITDVIRDFNLYQLDKEDIYHNQYRVITELKFPVNKPDCDWYTSSLVRAEATINPRSLIKGDVSLGKNIYYDDDTYVTVL